MQSEWQPLQHCLAKLGPQSKYKEGLPRRIGEANLEEPELCVGVSNSYLKSSSSVLLRRDLSF